MSKISIIMPVYNAQEWIKRAINSILNQTYSNLELICVDDCSKDDSVEIIKSIQQKDERVILIQNPKNLGPGLSRDNGIKNATGEYIGFVDADDFYELNAFEIFINAIKKYNTNAVFANWYVEKDGETIINKDRCYQNELYKVDKRATGFFISPWGKLYRKSFLDENEIVFGDYRVSDDRLFQTKAVTNMDYICLLEDYLYHWTQENTTSITKIKTTKTFPKALMYLDVVKLCHDYINSVNPDLLNIEADTKEIFYNLTRCTWQYFFEYCKKAHLLFKKTNLTCKDFKSKRYFNIYIYIKSFNIAMLFYLKCFPEGIAKKIFFVKNVYIDDKKIKKFTILNKEFEFELKNKNK